VPEGTRITVEADVRLAGKLKVLGFFAKGKIEHRLNMMIDEFARIAQQ
jgi:coenzyme Q-binding protein COQ10